MTADRPLNVIFVEDDDLLRQAMIQGLELEGACVGAFDRAAPALRQLSPDYSGVIVSDIRLPGMDGLEFFGALRAIDDTLPVIFTTGHGDVAMAVEAMKNGAADFLTKPYSLSALLDAIRRSAQTRELVLENRKLREALRSRDGPALLGSSETVRRLSQLVKEIAQADVDLLITGESGTGKSFLARQIHDLSRRSERPFVTIDAGSWAHQDAELIIFGRDPGSGLSRAGLIERAAGGTLFLDDIETMPEQFQARMLSVVEQRAYQPLGAERPRPANIRIISAARNQPLADALHSRAAQPLFHRLNSVNVALPTLRSHREDIPEIFRYFVARFEQEFQKSARSISEAQWHYLINHAWEGNLHELRSFARNFTLELAGNMPGQMAGKAAADTLKHRVAGFERTVIEDALRQFKGKIPAVARFLGTPRKTLYDKLARHSLDPDNFREPARSAERD